MTIRRAIHAIFILLMGLYLVVGLHIYRDYGVSIDEYSQIDLGRVNLARLAGSMEIQHHYDRYYGPAFEMPLFLWSGMMTKYVGISEVNGRHLGIFLFFFVSLIPWYVLLSRLFKHPAYGLLGSMLLVLYPRFFAEAFYNTKDIAFAAETLWMLAALDYTLRKQSWGLLGLSFVLGISIATRAQGLLLLGIASLVLAVEKRPLKQKFMHVGSLVVLTALFTFACFPVFWNNMFQNVIGFWKSSANEVGAPTWFMGRLRISPDLPWYYHDVWLGISTMLSVLGLSIAGSWYALRFLMHTPWDEKRRVSIACMGIFWGTLLTSALFHPRSYDGWRHVYYVYPSMIVLSLFALSESLKRAKYIGGCLVSLGIGLCVGVDLLASLFFIIRTHPNEYVYFNPLVGSYTTAKNNFDFDYWGISQKQLRTYLLTHPVSVPTRLWFDQVLPYTEREMIPALTSRNFVITDMPETADILVLINRDFRYVPSSSYQKRFAVTVGGADLSAIYVKQADQNPGK